MTIRWFSWENETTGAPLGESGSLETAQGIAARIAREPVVGKEPVPVNLYEEPGHVHLETHRTDGTVVVVSKPQPLIAAGAAAPRGPKGERPRLSPSLTTKMNDDHQESQRRDAHRSAAGCPKSAWHAAVLILEDANGSPVGWAASLDEAQAKADELGAVQLRDSVSWLTTTL